MCEHCKSKILKSSRTGNEYCPICGRNTAAGEMIIMPLLLPPAVQTFLLPVTTIRPDGWGCPYKQVLVHLN